MKIEWANNGEAYEINVDGEPKMVFSATIDLEDGEAVQKFEGESHKEITDKLLIAQANATARIRELRKPATPPATPPKAPLQFNKKPLTADERFTMAQDLSDPEKAPEAIRRAVEAELGAPLETVREKLQSDQDRDLQDQIAAAISQFRSEAKDFLPSQHNEDLIIKYGELHNYPPNDVASYHQIWDALKQAGLAQVKVPENNVDPNNPQPGNDANGGLPPRSGTRPRLASSSTSLRRGDSDDAPSGPAKSKYTREMIDAMPEDEFDRKLESEPGFRKLVDSLK
jgi:hypothetical protein